MKRTTNRLNHYLGRPSSRQDMKAMSAPNHGKSSLVGADGQLVTAIHQQESTHNQLWINGQGKIRTGLETICKRLER